MKKEELYENIPENPGVYIMKEDSGEILYIGKAVNLKKRVKSYFMGAHNKRVETMVQKISQIDYEETDSAMEALVLESNLIKKHQPPFNIKEKDDKSFLWVRIMDSEKYPRVLLARGSEKKAGEAKGSWFGPFTSSSNIRQALKILRKIFPYNTHKPSKIGQADRPCMYAQIGLCPGTCVDEVNEKEYKENIDSLKKVLKGKRKSLIEDLKEKMKEASDKKEFERAEEIKKQIFALQHIRDASLISNPDISKFKNISSLRIEGYDISNISGTSAVGAMVVFKGNKPNKSQYRKFKIKTIKKQDDVGMLGEMIERRLSHEDWPFPDIVLVDGGKGQVNKAKELFEEAGFDTPVVGIAKGPDRDKNRVVGEIPEQTSKETLIKVRDEAHRFAVKYHKEVRKKNSGIN